MIPVGSSERRWPRTALTAPASRVSAPADSAAYRTQNRRADMRLVRAANTVPTEASDSAAAALVAAASSTGTPASAASSADDTLDAIPPVPRWLLCPAVTPSRSAGPETSGMKCVSSDLRGSES